MECIPDENIDWVVYSLVNHNVRPQIDKSDNLKIGLFHGPIQGLTTDIGYKFEDGFDTARFKGCDLVLCGDIHKRQTFNIPNKKRHIWLALPYNKILVKV